MKSSSHACLPKGHEIIRKAGFVNEPRKREINQIRLKMGFTNPRDTEHRILARLFEAEWNNIMFKVKKATYNLAIINNLFTFDSEKIAEPILLLQGVVMEEYGVK